MKELIGKKNVKISVDGGINNVTAPACVMAGADILVAGSYVFKSDNYRQAIERLKQK
jgi:ribulose-phosphate 3-epimerase